MNTNRVETGHVSRFWNEDFKSLPFIKQPITEEEILKWQSQGYDHVKSFSGSMYNSKNIMPDWVLNMDQLFGMYKQTYTLYRMDTLEIMPVHSDHFNTYCRLHDTTSEKVQRVILMLEDWKPGHYFELDGIGYVNWKAGDWFKWTGDVPHAASNIGIEPRYTLQVTGMSILVAVRLSYLAALWIFCALVLGELLPLSTQTVTLEQFVHVVMIRESLMQQQTPFLIL